MSAMTTGAGWTLIADPERLVVVFRGVLLQRDQGQSWQPRPFHMLCALMTRAGEPVSGAELVEALEKHGLSTRSDQAPDNSHIRDAIVAGIRTCKAPAEQLDALAALVLNVRGRGVKLNLRPDDVALRAVIPDAYAVSTTPAVRPDVVSVTIASKSLLPFGEAQSVRFRIQLREAVGVEIVMPTLGGVEGPDGNALPSYPIGDFEARETDSEPEHMKAQRQRLGVKHGAYVLRNGTQVEVKGIPIGQEDAFAGAIFKDLRRSVRLRVAGQVGYFPDFDDPLDWNW